MKNTDYTNSVTMSAGMSGMRNVSKVKVANTCVIEASERAQSKLAILATMRVQLSSCASKRLHATAFAFARY
jgi:hypothetical protein